MLLTMMRRVEDVLVQVVRCVLLAFSLVVLIALAVWVWDQWRGSPKASAEAVQPTALNWKEAQVDLGYVVEETGRDLGNAGSQIPLEKRLTDPALRPSFQKADQLLRSFVEQDPAQRARVEQENNGQGLAPINPLLEGEQPPAPEVVERLVRTNQVRLAVSAAVDAASNAAVTAASEAAAAAAAASEASEEDGWLNDPIDPTQAIHERAQMAEDEHGPGSYTAYVQGLPAALAQVLGNKDLAPRLQLQPANNLVNMVLVNYTLSFDKAARALRGDEPEETTSFWDLSRKAMETAFWSMLMSFLVLVVMVVVFIRMERHLRVMSEHASRKD